MAANPGPPPFMPPPVGSAEREAWEDEVGPEEAYAAKKAWQDWFQREQAYIQGEIMWGGKDLEDIVTPWNPNEKYEDVHEKGQANFARYGTEPGMEYNVDEMRAEGLKRQIAAGDFGWDPILGVYRSGGRGPDRIGERFKDAQGRDIPAPSGANAFGQGLAYGGVAPTAGVNSNANNQGVTSLSRPYLNQPNYAYDRGWSQYLGRTDTSPTKKKSIFSTNPYGDIRQGGVNDPYNLPGRATGYIPGLSPTV
jgi:hypothetical protein